VRNEFDHEVETWHDDISTKFSSPVKKTATAAAAAAAAAAVLDRGVEERKQHKVRSLRTLKYLKLNLSGGKLRNP
jgi:hypothetical protein